MVGDTYETLTVPQYADCVIYEGDRLLAARRACVPIEYELISTPLERFESSVQAAIRIAQATMRTEVAAQSLPCSYVIKRSGKETVHRLVAVNALSKTSLNPLGDYDVLYADTPLRLLRKAEREEMMISPLLWRFLTHEVQFSRLAKS